MIKNWDRVTPLEPLSPDPKVKALVEAAAATCGRLRNAGIDLMTGKTKAAVDHNLRDIVVNLTAAIAPFQENGRREMSEWQPIATAPSSAIDFGAPPYGNSRHGKYDPYAIGLHICGADEDANEFYTVAKFPAASGDRAQEFFDAMREAHEVDDVDGELVVDLVVGNDILDDFYIRRQSVELIRRADAAPRTQKETAGESDAAISRSRHAHRRLT